MNLRLRRVNWSCPYELVLSVCITKRPKQIHVRNYAENKMDATQQY